MLATKWRHTPSMELVDSNGIQTRLLYDIHQFNGGAHEFQTDRFGRRCIHFHNDDAGRCLAPTRTCWPSTSGIVAYRAAYRSDRSIRIRQAVHGLNAMQLLNQWIVSLLFWPSSIYCRCWHCSTRPQYCWDATSAIRFDDGEPRTGLARITGFSCMRLVTVKMANRRIKHSILRWSEWADA